MGVKDEHISANQLRRTGLSKSDDRVAVFDREWEIAAHVRRAHALELGGRHTADENQGFGSAAERTPQRTDTDFPSARGD